MVNNPIPYGYDLGLFTVKGAQKDSSGNIVYPAENELEWPHQIYQDSIFRSDKAQLENFGILT